MHPLDTAGGPTSREKVGPRDTYEQKDPVSLPEAEIARDVAQFFALLLKGIKNISIYRHAEDRFSDFVAPAHQALTRFLEANSSLPLKLSPYTLQYKNIPVYEDTDKENLTYKFYRDGMRYVIFRAGLSIDELLAFVLLALESYSDRDLLREDMVTRFWKEDFQNIDHVVVEGFGFGDLTEEQVQLEVEKIIGYLRTQLAASSQDVTRFARLSLQDLVLELPDVEQLRGGIVSGRPATQQDREDIQDELLREEREQLFAKVVVVLFHVLEVEASSEDRVMLMEALIQLLDLYLVSDNMPGAVGLATRLEELASQVSNLERRTMVSGMRSEFLQRMVEPQRISQIGQYLQLVREIDTEAVREYLLACTEGEVPLLLDMLAQTERSEAKRLWIDVLVRVGQHRVDVFADRLESPSSTVVRDMLAIIFAINPPDKVGLVARCLEHPNVMIRLEGLKAMAKDQSRASLQYLQKALTDDDVQMRMGAVRALARRSPSHAAEQLIIMMKSPQFFQREVRERNAVSTALGETRTSDALQYLSSLFEVKGGLFNRGRPLELKMLAITGLQAMRTVEAFHVVNGEIQKSSHPMEVLKACHRAAHRIKGQLDKERRHG